MAKRNSKDKRKSLPSDWDSEGRFDRRVRTVHNHPLRFAIFKALTQKTASPVELAEELSTSVSNVSYHVKVLKNGGCIKPIRTAQVRGAVQHFYKAKNGIPSIYPRTTSETDAVSSAQGPREAGRYRPSLWS